MLQLLKDSKIKERVKLILLTISFHML